MVEPMNAEISIYRQCELLGLPRSSYYYESAGESEYNLELMKLIDEQYMRAPYEVYLELGETINEQAGLIHLKQPCFLS